MQRMSDDPLTDCPECEGHVHRVIQPVGVIFKGSGFYVTDNRQGSSSTLASAKESDKAETKTDPDAGDVTKESSAASTEKPDE
jgi:predicted nucleic acid-binding Zn ribbon protein